MQPVSGYQWKRISGTAAATTVIADAPATLHTISSGGNYTGTITFYDSATAAGTTGTNQMIAMNNNSGTVPYTAAPHVQAKVGITAVVGGTTDFLIGWSA